MAKQTQLSVDVEGKSKDTKPFALRGPNELVEALNAQVKAVMEKEGMSKQAEMLPVLSRLLEERYSAATAPAIASSVQGFHNALRVAEAQVNAIVEAYGTVDVAAEERVSARVETLTAALNEERGKVTELEGKKQEVVDELLKTKHNLEQVTSECATLRAEVEKLRGMVATLVAALALTPEEQAAAVAALCGEKGGE